MPALVACKRDPHVKTFYKQLLARGKKPIQAVVAVMRKLLHAIYGMLKAQNPLRRSQVPHSTTRPQPLTPERVSLPARERGPGGEGTGE
jgi:hypothetical protein